MDGADSYKIYASDDPYSVFDSLATVTDTTWTASIPATKKFYYVKASTEVAREVVFSKKRSSKTFKGRVRSK